MQGFRRRFSIFMVSAAVDLLLSLFFVFGVSGENPTATEHLHVQKHLLIAKSTCEDALHHDLCVSTLASFPDLASKSVPEVIAATVNRTAVDVEASASNCSRIRERLRNLNATEKMALDDCHELLDDTLDQMDTSITDLTDNSASKHINDLRTLLSAAMTNQDTCLDGLADPEVRKLMKSRLDHSIKMVSNSLAMLKKIPQTKGRKMKETFSETTDGFPMWMPKKDRRLLQAIENGSKIDLVVAKDGTGDFSTVGEAISASPNRSTTRFVIYVKTGIYEEYVEVPKKKINLMLIGDGINKTVITGNRSVVDGWTTFRSATVAVVGGGFIARDITFENTAGPSKHQAVALRSGSDLSAFYRCSFMGYQDTLYVHSLRQFFRECDVYGTVDFIFGDATAVFQNCSLYARRPNPGQKNLITAQGREDPNQNTGISIQHCRISAADDLASVKSSVKTYFGRPWKEYSRTVIMESEIDEVIDLAGWLEWSGNFALRTLYYGEYNNRGGGAATAARVTWPGFRVMNRSEAEQFTIEAFLQGREWLSSTPVPFTTGLN